MRTKADDPWRIKAIICASSILIFGPREQVKGLSMDDIQLLSEALHDTSLRLETVKQICTGISKWRSYNNSVPLSEVTAGNMAHALNMIEA